MDTPNLVDAFIQEKPRYAMNTRMLRRILAHPTLPGQRPEAALTALLGPKVKNTTINAYRSLWYAYCDFVGMPCARLPPGRPTIANTLVTSWVQPDVVFTLLFALGWKIGQGDTLTPALRAAADLLWGAVVYDTKQHECRVSGKLVPMLAIQKHVGAWLQQYGAPPKPLRLVLDGMTVDALRSALRTWEDIDPYAPLKGTIDDKALMLLTWGHASVESEAQEIVHATSDEDLAVD